MKIPSFFHNIMSSMSTRHHVYLVPFSQTLGNHLLFRKLSKYKKINRVIHQEGTNEYIIDSNNVMWYRRPYTRTVVILKKRGNCYHLLIDYACKYLLNKHPVWWGLLTVCSLELYFISNCNLTTDRLIFSKSDVVNVHLASFCFSDTFFYND